MPAPLAKKIRLVEGQTDHVLTAIRSECRKAKKGQRPTGHEECGPSDCALRPITESEWTATSVGYLKDTDLSRALKLAFPETNGRVWFTMDPETKRNALVSRTLPDGVESDQSAKTGKPETQAPPRSVPPAVSGSIDAIVDARIEAHKAGSVDESTVERIVERVVSERIPTVIVIRDRGQDKELPTVHHYLLPKIVKVMSRGLPVYLPGPAGSGKSTIMEQVAEALSLRFFAMSCDPTMSRHDVLGYKSVTTGEYYGTDFREAYENGGLFLFDEIDNGDPSINAGLNQALANGYCAFPDGLVKRSDSFYCGVTANTFGTGPDAKFVGRNAQDAAFLNRFRKIETPIDEQMERTVALGKIASDAPDEIRSECVAWIDRIVKIRAKVDALKLSVVVSPRDTFAGVELIQDGFTPAECLAMGPFAGLKSETIDKIEGR